MFFSRPPSLVLEKLFSKHRCFSFGGSLLLCPRCVESPPVLNRRIHLRWHQGGVGGVDRHPALDLRSSFSKATEFASKAIGGD